MSGKSLPGPARLGAQLAPWWSQRSPRERLLLTALGILVAGYAATFLVVQPLLAARAEARASIARSDMALARLAAAPAADPSAAGSGQQATAILTETAPEFGLSILRIEPAAEGARLTLQDASFEEVLRWIEAMESWHGLQVTAARLDRGAEPGTVGAELTLRR